MTDTNVTIGGKRGCSDTGITEELASKLYVRARDHKATELYAIVRFVGSSTTEDVIGSARTLNLSIADVEPVVDGQLNGELTEHVREIQRVLSYNRKVAGSKDEALPFDEKDGPAPKVADIVQQGKVFVLDEAQLEADEQADAAEDAADPEPDDTGDEASKDDPHPYVDTAFATCGYKDCGRAAGDELHAAQLAPV